MRRSSTCLFPILACVIAVACDSGPLPPEPTPVEPPFQGTIGIDPDILTASDPTSFVGLSYTGRGDRIMFDRRTDAWVTVTAYLFQASFDDGLMAEVQVNPELGDEAAARIEAERYAPIVGRLPTALRRDVEAIWIQPGTEPFGGGYNSLLIHVGQAAVYDQSGILEEVFVHEAAHTSLDDPHAGSAGWASARQADPTYISTYARDFPAREDVAETVVAWLAARYRTNRIPVYARRAIEEAVPNRLRYLDELGLEMHPVR